MRSFLSALTFLTVVPVPSRFNLNPDDLGRSTVFFPFIGLVMGLFAAGMGHLLYYVLPSQMVALFLVFLLVGMSGALHLDGFADTCDGFLSTRPRDKVLSIMRDSRVGTMGVAGIIFLVLMKWVSLTSIPSSSRLFAIVLMPLTGRTALLAMMAALPYARSEGGLATAFLGNRTLKWVGVAIGIGFMIIVSSLGFGRFGIIIIAISLGATALFSAFCYTKIGGYTGDTLGAVCEICELFPALVAVVIFYGGGTV